MASVEKIKDILKQGIGAYAHEQLTVTSLYNCYIATISFNLAIDL